MLRPTLNRRILDLWILGRILIIRFSYIIFGIRNKIKLIGSLDVDGTQTINIFSHDYYQSLAETNTAFLFKICFSYTKQNPNVL